MKTQFKTLKRLFTNHLSRFITIVCIVIVSIGFMSGIGEVKNKLDSSNNYYYEENNLFDLNIKSKKESGFTNEEIQTLKSIYGENNLSTATIYDEMDEFGNVRRIYFYDLNSSINRIELIEGTLPTSTSEIVIERETNFFKKHNIGDIITYNGMEYKICGIIFNPLHTYVVDEPSYIDQEKPLTDIFYFNFLNPYITTDIFITFQNRDVFDSFGNKYDELLEIETNKISYILTDIEILTLHENIGMAGLLFYGDKIEKISFIFVVFFLLVTLLVVYSTMTRLLDEERSQIATQKTLGYKDLKITQKYTLFVLTATIIGGIIAYFVGNLLTKMIYDAMEAHYDCAPYVRDTDHIYYFIVLGIVSIATSTLTLITGMKVTNKKPVTLLTPKVAKVGHKTLTENIPFIWNNLTFKYKSTIRNVFLFKSRFFMTVVSIIGSFVLVLAGMGLLDNTRLDTIDSSAITIIAIAVIAFSAALSLLVIYNITNINISERNREIATLMVLGYRKREVCGYIYREIYTMSLIGAILGLPIGLLFLYFAFDMIDYGQVSNINWYTFIISPIITMSFTFISTFFLRGKILKIDMNESLKSIE